MECGGASDTAHKARHESLGGNPQGRRKFRVSRLYLPFYLTRGWHPEGRLETYRQGPGHFVADLPRWAADRTHGTAATMPRPGRAAAPRRRPSFRFMATLAGRTVVAGKEGRDNRNTSPEGYFMRKTAAILVSIFLSCPVFATDQTQGNAKANFGWISAMKPSNGKLLSQVNPRRANSFDGYSRPIPTM